MGVLSGMAEKFRAYLAVVLATGNLRSGLHWIIRYLSDIAGPEGLQLFALIFSPA